MNISLPNEMRKWVETQISSGRYANASDYFRDLIRQNQVEVDAIRLALIEGEQSEASDITIRDIIDREKSRFAK